MLDLLAPTHRRLCLLLVLLSFLLSLLPAHEEANKRKKEQTHEERPDRLRSRSPARKKTTICRWCIDIDRHELTSILSSHRKLEHTSKVQSSGVRLCRQERKPREKNGRKAAAQSTADNPLDEIARAVGPCLDLWQRRDWPHRRGDALTLDLHSFPITQSSPGNRSV